MIYKAQGFILDHSFRGQEVQGYGIGIYLASGESLVLLQLMVDMEGKQVSAEGGKGAQFLFEKGTNPVTRAPPT